MQTYKDIEIVIVLGSDSYNSEIRATVCDEEESVDGIEEHRVLQRALKACEGTVEALRRRVAGGAAEGEEQSQDEKS
jgi:hypothetical protein